MTDRNGGATAPSKRPCVGPLVIHIDGFAARLGSEGYTPGSMHDKCELLADLSRWLDRLDLSRDALDEELLRHFHAARRRQGHVRRGEAATGRQLLSYLRDLGCIRALPPETDRTPLGDLTQDFGRYLSAERGLSPATLDNYLPIVRRFLIERFGSKPMRLDELRPVDIHRFIVRHAQTGSRRSAQLMVTALRSFLRFLQQRGAIATDLARGLPGVANWRLPHLPKSLPPEQVERMLAFCDSGTPVGQRDYAILLLLARLGLRAGEVVALTLDDLDWERGEIVVRGKGQRLGRLPLPTDVGAAPATAEGRDCMIFAIAWPSIRSCAGIATGSMSSDTCLSSRLTSAMHASPTPTGISPQRQSCCSTHYCEWSKASGGASHEYRKYIFNSA